MQENLVWPRDKHERDTTLYADQVHARSVDSAHHPSRSWVKALQARLQAHIPHGWRLCGENLSRHLARFSTEHAANLRRDVEALVERLSRFNGTGVRLWSFNGPAGLSVVAFEDAVASELLGCLRVYDRRMVSEDRWQELWGTVDE